MTGPVRSEALSTSHHPPSRRRPVGWIASAARQWWTVILASALVGGAFGFWSGSQAPYTSQVLFRVDTTSPDSTRVTQLGQTAAKLVDSDPVFGAASTSLGISQADLRNVATVEWVAGTELLAINTFAQSQDEADKVASTIGAAVAQTTAATARAQFDQVRVNGDTAISSGELADPDAERSRRSAVGSATAERQDSALAASVFLTPVGGPQSTGRAGISSITGVLLGFAGGALFGTLVAASLSGRRGRIRGAAQVMQAIPGLAAIDSERLSSVTQALPAIKTPLIGVLAMKSSSSDEAEAVANRVVRELHIEGRRPLELPLDRFIDEPGGPGRSPQALALAPAMSLPRRAFDLERTGADCLVVHGPATERAASRLTGRAELVLLLVSRGRTTFKELNDATEALGDSPVTVVIA
jgi:hypothetical protein